MNLVNAQDSALRREDAHQDECEASPALPTRAGSDLDQLVWFASSSLNDLQAHLATCPSITESQLNDLRVMVTQAHAALSKGLRAPRSKS